MTPAEYLRALDRAATPGPWKKEKPPTLLQPMEPAFWLIKEDVDIVIALRTLLPLLADVVEAATRVHHNTKGMQIFGLELFEQSLDRLTAAVAEVEKSKSREQS